MANWSQGNKNSLKPGQYSQILGLNMNLHDKIIPLNEGILQMKNKIS